MEVLGWINQVAETDYHKIEHLCDGIAYCHVLDALFPGKVPLERLDFNARSRGDFARNLRIFQAAVSSCGQHVEVSVDSLSAGKYKDNLELSQWCYQLVSRTGPVSL
ncbi:unnamed protein product [Choristocarpus tenellus]